MAQQKRYYTAEEAAEILDVTPGEVSQRRERNELHGLRDGATWKFKVEDIHRLAAELKAGKASATDEGDVLAAEVDLGPSASGKSGTVLQPGKAAHDSDIKLGSDIKLAGSDIKLAGSDVKLGSDPKLKSGSDAKLRASAAPPPELDMTLDADLELDDSQIAGADEPGSSAAVAQVPRGPGGSGIDLTGRLDDDDVVLGGGSKGSDVALGGDSGISLVDPADSGLSLEEPLEISASDDDSLELGEDDMLTFADAADSESPTELKSDDEFLLTPLEEAGDDDESDSGSQVIALDAGPVSDTAATMVNPGGSPMAMLDEELGPGGLSPLGGAGAAGSPLGFDEHGAGLGAPAGAAAGAPAAALPEAPYSGWNVAALSVCIVLLALCGWVAYDLMRNIWSWNGAYRVNSALMDWVLKLF